MNYFSVQNSYHIQIAKLFIENYNINEKETFFILNNSPHYHNVDLIKQKTLINAHPFSSGGGYKNIIVYLRSLVHYFKIKKSVNFKKKDKLFILSEYEVNNSILAKQNKKKGGVNYLIAESIGFYFNHHPYYKKKKENSIYLKFLNILYLLPNILTLLNWLQKK